MRGREKDDHMFANQRLSHADIWIEPHSAALAHLCFHVPACFGEDSIRVLVRAKQIKPDTDTGAEYRRDTFTWSKRQRTTEHIALKQKLT